MSPAASISAIIPVFNGGLYLAGAIESVLAQTCQVTEIIVSDDGSTDNTAEIARSFGDAVQYIHQANSGAADARNRGVRLADGEFLAFLDADDVWLNDKLARQIRAFENDPCVEMVFGHVQQFHSPELPEDVKRQIRIPMEITPGKHPGALLIRRTAFQEVGPFRSDWQIGEFLDWYARAEELGLKSVMLPDVVMKRRLHKASQGTYKREHQKDYVRLLKAALTRRRQLKQFDLDVAVVEQKDPL